MDKIQAEKQSIIDYLRSGGRRTKVPRVRPDSRFEMNHDRNWIAYEELFQDGILSRDQIPLGWEYYMTPVNKLRLLTRGIYRNFDFDKPKEV